MTSWQAPLQAPPRLAQAWSNVAWWAPQTEHHLDGLWQLHAYSHRGRLDADTPAGSLRTDLAPGTVTLLPPGTRSRYSISGRARFSCLHLALAPSATATVAAVLADDALASALVVEAATAASAGRSVAAAAAAWSALWRMAAGVRSDQGRVAAACAWIDSRLDDPPEVAALARRAGVSGAHLRRLFRAAFGLGVKPWIQRRRAERARHLLAHSSRSVRDIAAELGIPDLQRFNKLLHRHYGLPPRRLRDGELPSAGD